MSISPKQLKKPPYLFLKSPNHTPKGPKPSKKSPYSLLTSKNPNPLKKPPYLLKKSPYSTPKGPKPPKKSPKTAHSAYKKGRPNQNRTNPLKTLNPLRSSD
jgi:hypothetical protein